jgi:sarcosine oxidase subunit alpha
MSRRVGLTGEDGLRLVGLRPVADTEPVTAGAHLIDIGATAVAANDLGYVTSAAFSPHLGSSIGLALLARGDRRHGDIVRAVDLVGGTDVEVEVVGPHFVDPEGERLRG